MSNVFNKACASRIMLSHIACKWNMLVIDALAEGSMRHSALLRKIEGISQKMLTLKLRELEKLGLLERIDFQTMPLHVEYRLTPLGQSLRKEVIRLDRWIENNISQLAL